MLTVLHIMAVVAWVAAIAVVSRMHGPRTGVLVVMLSGALAALAFKPFTEAIFGMAVGDDEAAMNAGAFWLLNLMVWFLALLATSLFALPMTKRLLRDRN